MLRLIDDHGNWVTHGDKVTFSYGIPPVKVVADITEINGSLIGSCPNHNPPKFNLRSLRTYVGSWYKEQSND